MNRSPAAVLNSSPAPLGRARRVTILLAGVLILSIADLAVTLINLRTIGMIEANPIAYFIIDSTRSAVSLTCYKLLTVVICIALLHKLRHSVQSEIASWACLAILGGLALWWGHYAGTTTPDLLIAIQESELYGREWLTLAN